MSEINILVGLSGVGKSTVLEEAELLSGDEHRIINFGDRMLEVAKDEDIADDRDELKNLESEKQKKVQRDAAKAIVKETGDEKVIVDTHAAIMTPNGFLPGIPAWVAEELDPARIIILDASAEEIYSRTKNDNSREREHTGPEQIQRYREIAREMASAVAVKTGAYLTVIENPPKSAHKAAEQLNEVLES